MFCEICRGVHTSQTGSNNYGYQKRESYGLNLFFKHVLGLKLLENISCNLFYNAGMSRALTLVGGGKISFHNQTELFVGNDDLLVNLSIKSDTQQNHMQSVCKTRIS